MPPRAGREPTVELRRRRRGDGTWSETPTVRYYDEFGVRDARQRLGLLGQGPGEALALERRHIRNDTILVEQPSRAGGSSGPRPR